MELQGGIWIPASFVEGGFRQDLLKVGGCWVLKIRGLAGWLEMVEAAR